MGLWEGAEARGRGTVAVTAVDGPRLPALVALGARGGAFLASRGWAGSGRAGPPHSPSRGVEGLAWASAPRLGTRPRKPVCGPGWHSRSLPGRPEAGPVPSPAGGARFWGLEKRLCAGGGGKWGSSCQQVSARSELRRGNRGLHLLVAENTGILRVKAVVQGKAVVVVKSRISSFVCSENRSLPRLECGSETKNDNFWMNVLHCPILCIHC